ncbi:MAG: hypothetical protein JO127_03880 [Caulobacteraceae bacterium]|nr:hypothetical protein [Caulobacteraceae bacterium]
MDVPVRIALSLGLGIGAMCAASSKPSAALAQSDTAPAIDAAPPDQAVGPPLLEAPPPKEAPEPPVLNAPPAGQDGGLQPAPAPEAAYPTPPPSRGLPRLQIPSDTAAQMAGWVTASRDNGGLPFVIVDKAAADIFVFDAESRLLGAAPVLVGLAPGDESAAGVGDRALSAIRPDERTTPAGRFLAGFGAARGDRTVLWVDYADAISLHPVITTNPKEARLKRLRSRAPGDHRITYGCINVPKAFYDNVVLKAFAGGSGVVYVLPDTRPLAEVFPAFVANGGRGGVNAPPEPGQASPAAAGQPDPATAPREGAVVQVEGRP